MKNKLLFGCLVFMGAWGCLACGQTAHDESGGNAGSYGASAQKYIIDTKASYVAWRGSLLLDTGEDYAGYVYPSGGEMITDNGQLVGGKVVIDMESMVYKDRQHKNSPVFHLKSADYFDVEKFPTAAFVITGVKPAPGKTLEVKGKLTIKGVTRTVSFPAKMTLADGVLKADGQLVIDRTEWGIRYNSGRFYDVAADQVVADGIELILQVVARK
ncbi:YceI family protein [Emticicia sp. TH156]|uniref:YceI family protein n=1 Tax=Emticicia sp. TH156 TaxID=2067454 RepID=UPI000C76EBE3|nr:YceI family protein [Emticicia sp. TH156]PLK44419.1 YceI family protein [Emticicia sp. TH156]